MRLNAPSFVTFFLSLIIAIAAAVDKFGLYDVPVIGSANLNTFMTLLIAYVLLMLGNIIRGI